LLVDDVGDSLSDCMARGVGGDLFCFKGGRVLLAEDW
jgi:hypothetical protein